MKAECPECKCRFQTIDVDGVMSERRLMHEVLEESRECERLKSELDAERTVKNAVIKNYDIALDRNKTLKRERDEARAAYEAETLSTAELARKLTSTESTLATVREELRFQESYLRNLHDWVKGDLEQPRLAGLHHVIREMLEPRKLTNQSEMVKICAMVSPHTPRELCATAEGVAWLVERHKANMAALFKLEEIRTEKLAAKGLTTEASAVSAARVILLKSNRETKDSDNP